MAAFIYHLTVWRQRRIWFLSAFERMYATALLDCTEVHFASFLSGGFITAIVVNPPKGNWQNAPMCIVWQNGNLFTFLGIDIGQSEPTEGLKIWGK